MSTKINVIHMLLLFNRNILGGKGSMFCQSFNVTYDK